MRPAMNYKYIEYYCVIIRHAFIFLPQIIRVCFSNNWLKGSNYLADLLHPAYPQGGVDQVRRRPNFTHPKWKRD